jgi:hypothetical protein
MTDETAATEDQAEAEAERKKESLWDSFTRTDLKLLIVTFAGTLAANIVTVIVVAVAVVIARWNLAGQRLSIRVVIGNLVAAVVFMGCEIIIIRRMRRTGQKDILLVTLVAASGLFILLFVLVLIGYASGVR